MSQGKENSLTVGVLSNWASYGLLVISGFLVPRLISDRLGGAEVLGVWDFGWATAAYVNLLALGVAGACSRYVAHYRALGDGEGLNRIYNASLILLWTAFGLGLLLLAVLWILTPHLVREKAGAAVDQERLARDLVLVLGLSGAIQLPMGLYNGILTGCRRFALKNGVRVAVYGVNTGLIVLSLLTAPSLILVAFLYLIAELVIGAVNMRHSFQLCPELRWKPSVVTSAALRDVISFGGKTVLQGVARMTLYQTSGIILSSFMGLAALSVFARQRALINAVVRFMSQYGNVFTPQASALHSKGDMEELRDLVIRSARFGAYVALPIALLLIFAGSALVKIWMGSEEYVAPTVLTLLAASHFFSSIHRGAFSILSGMNLHGWASAAELAAAGLGILGCFAAVYLGAGLGGVALAVGVADFLGGAVAPALLVCRAVQLRLRDYVARTLTGPLLACLPLAVLFFAGSRWFKNAPLQQLTLDAAIGGALLLPIYWRYVLTEGMKEKAFGVLARMGRLRPGVAAGAVEGAAERKVTG